MEHITPDDLFSFIHYIILHSVAMAFNTSNWVSKDLSPFNLTEVKIQNTSNSIAEVR